MGQHLDLAAPVDLEGAVDHLEQLHAVESPHGVGDLSGVLLRQAVDRDVLDQVAAAHVEAGELADVAAGVAYGDGEAPQRAGDIVHADGEADRERSGGGGHGPERTSSGRMPANQCDGPGCMG
jgi:hypothetical protein